MSSSQQEGLRFFYSEIANDELSSRDIVTAAQQVHAVISDLFSRTAVLPFRYPTVMASEAELVQLAKDRGAAFRDYFERVGSKVQMDIRLTFEPLESLRAGRATGSEAKPGGGRAYLEARASCQALLSVAAERCRLAAHSADWRIQQRGENIRCQALISRVEVVSFLERMRKLELPGGVRAAVSGPWPPAGFWEDEPR